ncbi:MAG TPA: hypothetical protein PLP70_01890 [bacterium]|jgi:predicted PurR-regulated permease PerM|nr:MAG: hypothetical protein BWX53_00379 [Parcubacteria group bacterium ADurb.Bin016]HNQ45000.1 hypothetical protein [bacterium]HNU90011.1 hypothetical protein [bacterium]HPL83486.1 hypothetical protein [bacterium]HPX64704.1 hypothetical protein [bacterium]
MANPDLPKDISKTNNIAASGLKEVWRAEEQGRRRHKLFLIIGILLVIIVIGGLGFISWPYFQSQIFTYYDKISQEIKSWPAKYGAWQKKNEEAIIRGEFIK